MKSHIYMNITHEYYAHICKLNIHVYIYLYILYMYIYIHYIYIYIYTYIYTCILGLHMCVGRGLC